MSYNISKGLLFVFVSRLFVCLTKSTASEIDNAVTIHQLPKMETFTFLCQRQMVKVNSNIYHLDRMKSSLKSNYFYYLFTDDSNLKNDKVLEIQIKNGELFPHAVDLIHGRKKLIDVLSKDNYLAVLEMMNHLIMEIDLITVSSFLDDELQSYSSEDAKIIELYKFIENNQDFEYLLTSVFKSLSKNLTAVRNHEIFPSMPVGHLIRIIKSVENVGDEKRCEIVKTCTKWLCYNLENRLPHLVIMVNSIKPQFDSGHGNNDFLAECSPNNNMHQKTKRKVISGCFFALLAPGGKLNPTIYDQELSDSNSDGCNRCYTDCDCEYESEPSKEEFKVYEEPGWCPNYVNSIYESQKLNEFLKNGVLYDITVRVEGKLYKLHRQVLESKCGYFADIFRAEYAEAMAKCEGIPTCPCKDKEYLLDGVDQSTFDIIIEYIYFNRENIKRTYNGVGRLFKTVLFLKIEDLFEKLEEHVKCHYKEVSPQDIIEILNGTHGITNYNDLYLPCLSKYFSTEWPKIDYTVLSQFRSISYTMLENILRSPDLNLEDPYKILDICSTWIIYDVMNRYAFLPRIASAVNPNCVTDEEAYETKALAELNNCSQQFVRDKLWEILSTLSYNIAPSNDLKKSTPKKLQEIPVFIKSKLNQTIDILNVDLAKIASFAHIPTKGFWFFYVPYRTSATMMNENLFILLDKIHFVVYNFSLKKCFVLNDSRGTSTNSYFHEGTLLNCNNEIYCCKKTGEVMKFSMQLNQWAIISKNRLNAGCVLFISDGQRLYRMYEVSKRERYSSYIVEPYDFEKNIWSRESSLPLINDIIPIPHQLSVVVNDYDLVVSTFADIISFDRESKTWSRCQLPYELWGGSYSNLFAQCDDRRVLIIKNKFYNYSPSNGTWELKRELPFEHPKSSYIEVIHSPAVSINSAVQRKSRSRGKKS